MRTLSIVPDGSALCLDAEQRVPALFLPYALEVGILLELHDHRITGWDLAERAPHVTRATAGSEVTHLARPSSTGDRPVVAERG